MKPNKKQPLNHEISPPSDPNNNQSCVMDLLVLSGCSAPSSSRSSGRRIGRRLSEFIIAKRHGKPTGLGPKISPGEQRPDKEQLYEELCAALLLTAKEASRDHGMFDMGACAQRNTRAKQLWELCNSLMLSALVARVSLSIKEGEVGAIGMASAATPLHGECYILGKWKSEPYKLQQEVMGVEAMLEPGTKVADAVLYYPVRLKPGWYTPSTVEVVVEVAQVLLTGLSLMTIRDHLMTTKGNLNEAVRHPQAAKVPLCLHESILEAALQRERLVCDESESESDVDGDDDSDGSELSDDND